MTLKFYTSVEKLLKLKVRTFWGLIPAFVKVKGEKIVQRGPFCLSPPPTHTHTHTHTHTQTHTHTHTHPPE